jgi:hypothetical protein
LAAVQAYCLTFVQHWVDHPQHFRMIYGEVDNPKSGERFFADSELVQQETRFLQNLLIAAGIPDEHSALACQQTLCVLHGVSLSLVTIGEFSWRSAPVLLDSLLEGLILQYNK